MQENRYYKGRDIRAVENPYEGAFELAEKIKGFLKGTRYIILGLMVYFLGYFLLTMRNVGVLILTIVLNIEPDMIMALVLYTVFYFIIGVISLYCFIGLFRSNRFMKDMMSNQSLMLKIERHSEHESVGSHGQRPLPVSTSPVKGLLNLIKGTSEHTTKLVRTSRFILYFIISLLLLGTVQVSIRLIASLFVGVDPISASSLAGALIEFFFLFTITYATYVLTTRFEFVSTRYKAIEYAMNLEPVIVPKGQTVSARYMTFISSQKGYERMGAEGAWKKDDHFDITASTKNGLIFVKFLKKAPSMTDLEEVERRIMLKAGKEPLDRVAILYEEALGTQVPEDAYRRVLERPIIRGKDVCSIQIVEEEKAGTYDFLPVVSF